MVLWVAVPEPSLFLDVNRMANRVLPDRAWAFLNMFGNGWAAFAFSSPLLVFAPRLLVAGITAGAISGLLSRALKLYLEFPRPAGVLDISTFHILGKPLTSLSMPSGHTLTAFSLATAFYFSLSPRQRKPYLLVFLAAGLAGIARIAVGAHWPADVMAGSAIGLFSGVLGAWFACQAPKALLDARSWLLRVLALGALLCGYMLATSQIDFPEAEPFQVVGIGIVLFTTVLFVRQQFVRQT